MDFKSGPSQVVPTTRAAGAPVLGQKISGDCSPVSQAVALIPHHTSRIPARLLEHGEQSPGVFDPGPAACRARVVGTTWLGPLLKSTGAQ